LMNSQNFRPSLRPIMGFIVAVLVSWPATVFSEVPQTLYLLVGAKDVLTLDEFADRVIVPDSGIVDVARGDSKKKLIVTGKGRGSTNVKVILRSGKTQSFAAVVSDPGVLRSALAHVSSIPGVKAEIKGGKVI